VRKTSDLNKENQKRTGRDGLMTDRGNRGATLSPTANM